jgi:hypothetical protein
MHITLDPSLPKKIFPFALFFSTLGELDRTGAGRLSDFLNARVTRVDGGLIDGYLVSVIWFDDVADYIITTQESVATAIHRSLEAVAGQLGVTNPVRMVFGVVTRPERGERR